MGWLAERVRDKEQRLTDQQKHKDYVEQFEKAAPRLVWMDEEDEHFDAVTGRTNRSTMNAEMRGIDRLLQLERKIANAYDQSTDPGLVDELNRLYCTLSTTEKETVTRGVSRQRWEQEKYQDMVDNYLYQEWLDQLNSREAIRTFSAYATFVSAKAVISLLTTHKNGEEQLRQMHPTYLPIPMREKAIAFKNQIDYDPHDVNWYIGHVFGEVPGTWEAAQTLQQHYGDFVRATQDAHDGPVIPTELPDDPVGMGLADRYKLPEDIRMEAAVKAFEAGEGNTRQLGKQYGVPREKLRDTLRERGILKHGGDRKATKGN